MDPTYSEYFSDQKEKRIQKFVAQILTDGPNTSDEDTNEDDNTEASTTLNTTNNVSNVSVNSTLSHTRNDESSIFFLKHSDQDRKYVAAHVKRLKKEVAAKAAQPKPNKTKSKKRTVRTLNEMNQNGRRNVVSLIKHRTALKQCQSCEP